MTIHELEIWPQHFRDVLDGAKRADCRAHDRDYAAGDRLHLREYDPGAQQGDRAARYTGRDCWAEVTHVLPIDGGRCVLSIRLLDSADAAHGFAVGDRDWRVEQVMQAASEMSLRQLSDVRGRLAALASRLAKRRMR